MIPSHREIPKKNPITAKWIVIYPQFISRYFSDLC